MHDKFTIAFVVENNQKQILIKENWGRSCYTYKNKILYTLERTLYTDLKLSQAVFHFKSNVWSLCVICHFSY